jgi:hypothetical protein
MPGLPQMVVVMGTHNNGIAYGHGQSRGCCIEAK